MRTPLAPGRDRDGRRDGRRRTLGAVRPRAARALAHRACRAIGDAAHAMVPHQGQGANQTIEDAIALADCLTDAADLASALRTYEERRRKRTSRVQRWSRRAVDLMHLPDGPEIAPRDALFRELDSELAWIHAYDAHQAAVPSPR